MTVLGCGANVLEKNLCYEISIWRHKSQHRYAAKVGPSVVPCAATLLLDDAVDAHPGLGFGLACLFDPLCHKDPNKSMTRVLQQTLRNKKLLDPLAGALRHLQREPSSWPPTCAVEFVECVKNPKLSNLVPFCEI